MEMTQDELKESFGDFRESMFKAWDAGFAEGLELDFMLADIKDFVAASEVGPMDNVVEYFFKEWRDYRGV